MGDYQPTVDATDSATYQQPTYDPVMTGQPVVATTYTAPE